MRLGDGGRGVDYKSGISCGFGIFFSLQISNVIFDSSLQNFRPEFVHHSCSRAFGHGNFRPEFVHHSCLRALGQGNFGKTFVL
nr:hypothetical protein CFP56_25420 [Quercus suber]